MNSDVMEKNTFLLIWDILTFDSVIDVYRKRKKFVIRSPVFIAKCLDRTSWFLSITLSQSDEDHFVLSLNRSEEDKGTETVEIDWEIKFSEEIDFQKEGKIINFFKKGGSNRWGILTRNRGYFLIRKLKIICEMNKCFPGEMSIIEFGEAITEISNERWMYVEDKLLICGPNNIRYELSFFETDSVPLNIRIRRTDEGTSYCYLICFINIYQEIRIIENLISSMEIDYTDKVSNKDDIIEMAILKKKSLGKFKRICAIIDVVITDIFEEGPYETQKIKDGNKTLKISKVVDETDTVKNSKYYNDATLRINSLGSDFIQLYKNGMHADVTLLIGNETFKSHKFVLSARSPVFSVMFHQDILENQTDIVTITDMEASTLSLLLDFMYTDTVDELDTESALKLLLAAEKYQILLLKEMCSSHLAHNLSESNVCDILNTADMAQDNGLKASAIEYVKKYAHNVLNSESWKQLVASNASVVAETLGKISFDLWTTTSKRLDSWTSSRIKRD